MIVKLDGICFLDVGERLVVFVVFFDVRIKENDKVRNVSGLID